VRTLSSQMRDRSEKVGEQLVTINAKLDAIMSGEVLVTKEQFLRLLRMLEAAGITIDEQEIFSSST